MYRNLDQNINKNHQSKDMCIRLTTRVVHLMAIELQ